MAKPGTISPEQIIAQEASQPAGTQFIKDERSREDRALKRVIIHSLEPDRERQDEFGASVRRPGIDWWTKDYPNTGVDSHFYWQVNNKKSMERRFACMRFGDFDMDRDDKKWPAMMRALCLLWDIGRPPFVIIYDEETGAKLWDSEKEYKHYFQKWARHERFGLPTTTKFARFLPAPAPPPRKLVAMDQEELLALAKELKYPVNNNWSNAQLVGLLTSAPNLPAKYLEPEIATEAKGKEMGFPAK